MAVKIRGTRPRIGVDLHTLEGMHQGSRTHCFELFSRVIRRLPGMDFRFFVDTRRWDLSNAAIFTASNATVVDMPHSSPPVRLLHQLPSLTRKHAVDLLHTQYICPPFLATKTAVTIHDILCYTHPRYFSLSQRIRSQVLFRLSAARSDMVFTVSDYTRQQIEQEYRVPASRLKTIYNAVSSDRFYPGTDGAAQVAALGLAPGEYLLSVGRLEPRKNHVGLLRAFALLPQPRPRLAIVGARDFGYENIFKLRDELHLQDDVIVLEAIDDGLLPSLYRNAKLVAYPSFAEGFGIPVLEAMASGVPVITSNTTALPEVAGDVATLVDPSSVESIFAGLQLVLNDSAYTTSQSARGIQRSKAFSWETSADVLAAAYETHFALAR